MNLIPRLKCLLFGHSYRVHQAFTPYSRRVVCDCCRGDWAMNDNVGVIVRWNGSFEELYRTMGHDVRPVKLASRLGPEVPVKEQ